MIHVPRRPRLALFVLIALLSSPGCNIIGAVAQLGGKPPIDAAYKNLHGQTVGVIVWVDRGVKLDYPQLQADIAGGLTSKLKELTRPKDPKAKPQPELAGVDYLAPMSVIKFQEEHPELEGLPARDIATRLGVTRVIYIEVKEFRTRAPESPDLLKGTLITGLQVMEVTPGPNKVATVAYDNPELEINYPPNRPEGIPFSDVSNQMIYDRTIDYYTTEVAELFFKHPAKE